MLCLGPQRRLHRLRHPEVHVRRTHANNVRIHSGRVPFGAVGTPPDYLAIKIHENLLYQTMGIILRRAWVVYS